MFNRKKINKNKLYFTKERGLLMQQETIGFVGTYTRETSEGIYRFTLDYVEETLKNVQVAAKLGSPTYLSIAEKHLYAVAQNGEQGGIAAYELTKETGGLRYLNRKLADGAPPRSEERRVGKGSRARGWEWYGE